MVSNILANSTLTKFFHAEVKMHMDNVHSGLFAAIFSSMSLSIGLLIIESMQQGQDCPKVSCVGVKRLSQPHPHHGSNVITIFRFGSYHFPTMAIFPNAGIMQPTFSFTVRTTSLSVRLKVPASISRPGTHCR